MPSSKIELLIQQTNLCDYNKIDLSIDYINAGHIDVVVVSDKKSKHVSCQKKKTHAEEIPFPWTRTHDRVVETSHCHMTMNPYN